MRVANWHLSLVECQLAIMAIDQQSRSMPIGIYRP